MERGASQDTDWATARYAVASIDNGDGTTRSYRVTQITLA